MYVHNISSYKLPCACLADSLGASIKPKDKVNFRTAAVFLCYL